MIELLSYPFVQNAILAAILASVSCGIIGTFVVIKRMSTLSGSISHAAFGGIGMSYYFGLPILLGAFGFGLLAALAMGSIRYFMKERQETLIAALWAVGMAVGILFIFKSNGYTADLFGYLFGNILLTSRLDLMLALGLNGVVILSVILVYRGLQAITFDQEFATVVNLPVYWLYLLLITLITLTVIILIRLVGVILVLALLTLPPTIAGLYTRTIYKGILLAVAMELVATLSGLMISIWLNLPPGPIIILVCFVLYCAALIQQKVKKNG